MIKSIRKFTKLQRYVSFFVFTVFKYIYRLTFFFFHSVQIQKLKTMTLSYPCSWSHLVWQGFVCCCCSVQIQKLTNVSILDCLICCLHLRIIPLSRQRDKQNCNRSVEAAEINVVWEDVHIPIYFLLLANAFPDCQ